MGPNWTRRRLHPGRGCKDVHNSRARHRLRRIGIYSLWHYLLDNHIVLNVGGGVLPPFLRIFWIDK